MNSLRLHQRLSGVYASATRSGSLLFQASTAHAHFPGSALGDKGWQWRPA
jgi:hypothetical protein